MAEGIKPESRDHSKSRWANKSGRGLWLQKLYLRVGIIAIVVGHLGESGLWLQELYIRVGIIAKVAGPLESQGYGHMSYI
jgi:hypothetical protein